MTELPEATRAAMRSGVAWVPSPLALDMDKNFLEDWQRLLTLYYIRSGARTVIPAAHTGEFAGGDLDLYERWLALVAETVEQSGENMFLMAAVGGPDARRQAELAAEHSYDVAMVAPTAFGDADDAAAVQLFRDIASVIPAFAFELQRAIPGSREYTASLWDAIFEVACGAKGASFDTYRAARMLQAAARSPRRDELILATGNDDRIVHDLGGRFPFVVDGQRVTMTYKAGLLGHFATDTRAAVEWASAVVRARDGNDWSLPVPERELAHYVNVCNGALFDALGNFENSVWGVKRRLTALGLLPGPWCFHESGRPGQAEAIERAYNAQPILNDRRFVDQHLSEWKREVGL
ncbi:MAG: hypothetical protein R6X33_11915 [Candidatus Brocadiia bacterium]